MASALERIRLKVDLDQLSEEIKHAASKFFPAAAIRLNIVRNTALYIRISFHPELFIDIYANSETERKDFALIYRNARIYGIDNLKGWHYHPFGEADKHIFCDEPSLEEVFRNVRNILEILSG